MKINLTLNKPAVTSFLATGEFSGMRIKIQGKQVLLKASKAEKGAGVFPLFPRTRGGMGVTIEGRFAEQFLAATGLTRGDHMKLEPTSYKWMMAEAVAPGTKPSKIVPTARLWREIEEVQGKEVNAPVKATRIATSMKVAKVTVGVKKRGPGRPSKASKEQIQ